MGLATAEHPILRGIVDTPFRDIYRPSLALPGQASGRDASPFRRLCSEVRRRRRLRPVAAQPKSPAAQGEASLRTRCARHERALAATVESAKRAGRIACIQARNCSLFGRIVTLSSALGLSRARISAGLASGAGSLILLTVWLVAIRGTFSLADVVLLYLIPVVIAAVVGGLWAALPGAIAADLVVNFFFVPPYYTLIVGNAEHVIVLLTYVLVALAVSLAVDFAARQRAQATRRETEARLLARANKAPLGEGSLPELLNDQGHFWNDRCRSAGERGDW